MWVDDPAFTLDYHLRYTAVPAPGGDDELCNLVGRVLGQPLDGATGDYDSGGDIGVLARGIEQGLAELVRAAAAEPR